jgi:heme/copper-type cytochrome/quinol oxidase subunit 4
VEIRSTSAELERATHRAEPNGQAVAVAVMRRIISFVLALCLTAFGAFALVYLMVFAAGWKGWMVMGAGLMFVVGVVWLYSDYIDATPNQPK